MGRQGWQVERIRVEGPDGVGMAQVLFRHRGPVSLASLPRGPVIEGDPELVAPHLFEAVEAACRRHRAIDLVVEHDQIAPLVDTRLASGFVRSAATRYPARTVKVPLLEDEALIAQMHHAARYNLRVGRKRGVTVARSATDTAGVAAFHGLLQETADRNAFQIDSQTYFEDFLRTFGDDAVLLFAMVDDAAVAGMIGVRFGTEAMYLFGASSTTRRVRGATVCLQFEAMGWARSLGCTQYDLWGIPAADLPRDDTESRGMASRGADMRGLYGFKVAFGGEIVAYPPALKRRYHPCLSWIVRRAWSVRPDALR